MAGSRRPDSLSLIRRLERGAAVLRRLGLGTLVDRVRDRTLYRLGRVTVDVDGIALGGNAAHSHYLAELRDDARERHMAALFEQAVPAGGLVLDVGAHLGYFTLLAARRGAHVIAVEPNPRTLEQLRENVRANGAQDQVTIVAKALAGEPGRRRFHLSRAGDTSSLHEQEETVGALDVEVTRADALVGGRSVDVIKIDVEGGELEALAGMGGTIAAAAGGLRLFIECNQDALERAGASAAALVERLRALGLEPAVIDEANRALRPVHGDPGGSLHYVNLLCVRA
jgi:FkbM family methyltransferase